MISNGGLGQRGHFQVVAHWIKRLALNNLSEVIGEIYAPQGPLLANPAKELQPLINNYQQLLQRAGKEVVTENRLSDETQELLGRNLIPEDIYLQQINGYFEGFLSNLKHSYLKGWE